MAQGSSSPASDIKRLGGSLISTGTGSSDSGTLRVQLAAESLSAIESISVTIPGTVDLGTVSLTALEVIKVTNDTGTSLAINDNGSSITVDGTVTVADGGSSITVDGSVSASQSGSWTVVLGAGSASVGTVELGATTLAALETVSVNASQTGTWTVQPGNTPNSTPWLMAISDGSNAAAIKAASTAAVAADKALVVAISPNNTVAVTGALTDTQLRASAVPVSLASVPSHAVTNAGTFVVQENGAALTSLQLLDDVVATDGSTAATKLYQVGGTDGTNAQIISVTSSGAVNIADGGSTISVDDGGGSLTVDGTVAATQSGTWNVTNISGTVSLPTGASTSANQSTMIASLGLLDDVVATDGSTATSKLYQVGGIDGSSNAQILSVTTAGALNIADGGNSITVDGSVTIADGGNSITVDGTFWQATQPVSIAAAVAVTDNSGSLTVDAPASAPVFVRLSSGSAAVDTIPVSTSFSAKSNATTSAYATNLIVKASAGTLYMLNGYNSSTSDQFIQLHDSATLPADATAPKLTLLAPAQSSFYFDFGVYGRSFSSGITVCNSSTGATKTIGSADCWFDAQYS